MPSWTELLHMLSMSREGLFEGIGVPLSIERGERLEDESVQILQRVLLGACRAALVASTGPEPQLGTVATPDDAQSPSAGGQSPIPDQEADSQAGAARDPRPAPLVSTTVEPLGRELAGTEPLRGDPLLVVDPDLAADCFAAAAERPIQFHELLDVFRPTVILYDGSVREAERVLLGFRDTARPDAFVHGVTAVVDSTGRGELRALGDAFLLPPARPGENLRRSHWIRRRELDPPRWGEPGGPYWRLGTYNLWRLDVLAWHERLVLAALVGTSCREAVILAAPRLFPRVGFVAEVARQMGRTLIGVPMRACPVRLLAALERARTRRLPRASRQYFHTEEVLRWRAELDGRNTSL